MNTQMADVSRNLQVYLPNMLAAVGILLVGWIVAAILSRIARSVLERANLDNRLAGALGTEEGEVPPPVTSWISLGVFYLIMLFVLGAFFQQLNLTAVSVPLSELLSRVLLYLPNLLGAAILALVAWVLATVVRVLVLRVTAMAKLDERLAEQTDGEEATPVSLGHSLATAASGLVYLAFLPPILNTLQITGGMVDSMQQLLNTIVRAVPNIFFAAIIMAVGWFIARILRQIVTTLLVEIGIDRLGQRAGLGENFRLSRLVGTVVYALILIPTAVSALNQLGLDEISGPATSMLQKALSAIPNLFAAVLLLAVAYLAGRLISGLATNILAGIGFDELPARLGLMHVPVEGERSPSNIAGYIGLVAIMLFAAGEAAGLLGFDSLVAAIEGVIRLGGQALIAMAILTVGLYFANIARSTLLSAAGAEAATLATVVRWAILIFVGAMALSQMDLGKDIVNDAFRALVFGLGAAAALAFGLGGRETAGRILEEHLAQMGQTYSSGGVTDENFRG